MAMIPGYDPRAIQGLTAEQLAARVQEGSKKSFAELVRRYGPRLFRYFRQKVASREDCEDLVQETLVKAYRNIHRYRRSQGFTTWLFTIGTRRVVDHFRSQGRHDAAEIPDNLSAGDSPYEQAARQDERDRFWQRARALPKKQVDVLWLRYAEELQIRDIARILGLTRVHVKVLLYRARTRLAQLHKQGSAAGSPTSRDEALEVSKDALLRLPDTDFSRAGQ